MSRITRRFTRIAAATLMTVGLLAPAAAHAQSPTIGFKNVDGSLTCDQSVLNGKTHILCHVPVARPTMEECNPPNELVPAFVYYEGKSVAKCWNQGRTADNYRTLQPWIPQLAGEVLIIPTGDKGFHFLGLSGYLGYAGPGGVSDSSGLAKLSSRLF